MADGVSAQVPASRKRPVRSAEVTASGVTVAPVEVVTAAVLSSPQAASRLPSPTELIPAKIARRLTRCPS